MLKGYVLAFLSVFLFSVSLKSQVRPLDTAAINKTLETFGDNDSLKSRYIINLADTIKRPQPELAAYIRKAIDYASKTGSVKLYADAIKQAGFVEYYNGNLPEAAIYFRKASILYDSLNDYNSLLTCYVMLASHFFYLGQYDLAIYHNRMMIPVAKKAGNTRRLSAAYRLSGVSYLKLGMLDSALFYVNMAIDAARDYNSPLTAAYNFNALGDYYLAKGDSQQAYYYYSKSLSYCSEADSCLFAKTMLYNNLAAFFLEKNNLDSVQRYIDKALENKRIIKAKAITYMNAAQYYKRQKQYATAIKYLDSAQIIFENIGNIFKLDEIYTCYADIYWSQGDLKNYHKYVHLKFANVDSIKTNDIKRQKENLNAYFEISSFRKKVKHLLAAEKERQRRIRKYKTALSLVGFLILLALLFIYTQAKFLKRLKQKNRVISEHRAEIMLQAEKLKEQRDKLEEQNTMINSSLKCALSIQDSTLPLDRQLKDLLHEYYLIYRPMQIVSGDFYWVARQPGTDIFYVAVADGTGHGVPGAFISLITARLLDEIVLLKNITKPGKVLTTLNSEIIKLVGKKRGMYETVWGLDIILLRIEKIDGMYKVDFSGAKLPLVYCIPGQEIQYLKTTRRSIGGFFIGEQVDFDQDSVVVPQGTTFYLFTDGYKDQVCKDSGKRMGSRRFMELLNKLKDLSVEAQGQEMDKYLDSCMVNSEQRDDITVLIFRL